MNTYQEKLKKQIHDTVDRGLKETSYSFCPSCQTQFSATNYCVNCGVASFRVNKLTRPDFVDQVVQSQEQWKRQAIEGHSKFSKWLIEFLETKEFTVLSQDVLAEHKVRSQVSFYGGIILLVFITYSLSTLLGVFTGLLTGGLLINSYRRYEFEKVISYILVVLGLQMVAAIITALTDVYDGLGLFIILSILFVAFDTLLLSSCLYSTAEPLKIEEQLDSDDKVVQVKPEYTSHVIHERVRTSTPSPEFKYRKSTASRVVNVILFTIVYIPLLFISYSLDWFTGSSEFSIGFFIIVGAVVGFYLIPTFISGTNRKVLIFFFNVILGITGLGWFILLFLALDGNSKERQRQEMNHILNKMADRY